MSQVLRNCHLIKEPSSQLIYAVSRILSARILSPRNPACGIPSAFILCPNSTVKLTSSFSQRFTNPEPGTFALHGSTAYGPDLGKKSFRTLNKRLPPGWRMGSGHVTIFSAHFCDTLVVLIRQTPRTLLCKRYSNNNLCMSLRDGMWLDISTRCTLVLSYCLTLKSIPMVESRKNNRTQRK
ncbi:hypothetical protein P280DRAFT_19598 [Massarina eburnea CBS 473.64]|uniref:Uncharacterized protein n=1 Tax=Massarina eburnea CBS 473.64 TaxID=1395130 RepID=A0A6A6SFX8_9PLEO|nr:hypothetical protein P280DRAFT_19598 [Massarina eburnea CBS 473.64]